MDEVLVPSIKEEPHSDSEADPLSWNIDLRKVKVGYVKKRTFLLAHIQREYLNAVCRFGTFQIFIFNVVQTYMYKSVIHKCVGRALLIWGLICIIDYHRN
jgi:hypothetical protein